MPKSGPRGKQNDKDPSLGLRSHGLRRKVEEQTGRPAVGGALPH